jgi:hypothetical protein
MFSFPDPDRAGEPPRDERLAALLREAVGETPMATVDWATLADRVGAALRGQQFAPWWSHVARWQRRALPLALAAGLVGGLALWNAARGSRGDAVPLSGGSDLVTAVVAGVSSADAALSYARSVTGSVDLTAGMPE